MNRPPGRVLAFDWGLKRIGVAVGNTLLATSEPLCVLRARDGVPDWEAISALLEEWQPKLLVVGDPLNMDESVAEITRRARRFSRQLEGRFNLPVSLIDERLTSREARIQLEDQGLPYQGAVDAHAAQLILQTWLSEHSEG
ncbi:MAG: Holliday junction resolvase RuvX [Luminiphilus sp.]|nr:Holliday junction resolvase RuvX [Luminiphilus sp.]